jgi:hypothetical protein
MFFLFFSFLFFFISLSSSSSSRSISCHVQQEYSKQNTKTARAELPLAAPTTPLPHGTSQATPLPCTASSLSPAPSFPSLPSHHGCFPWAQVRPWPPPMESLTQAHFSSWDDQNSHKLVFLHGMITMGAHHLPLAIPALNFIRNEL